MGEIRSCSKCGARHSTESCIDSERSDISVEQKIRDARHRVAELLISRGIVSDAELILVDEERIDELIVRSVDDLKAMPEHVSDAAIEKTRRMLGVGVGVEDEEKRAKEIERLKKEMFVYIKDFQHHEPRVVGMVLCGSRLSKSKQPSASSDVDTVLILRGDTTVDPTTKEGKGLLFSLRDYTDSTKTASGFDVELDEIYSENEFLDTVNEMGEHVLVWGWDPEAVEYIGDDLASKEAKQ